MAALAADLEAESAVLHGLLADLDEETWSRATPAEGWTIADQVSHLAHFDDVAMTAATEPEAFRAELADQEAHGGIDPNAIAERHRSLTAAQLLGWFDTSRTRLITMFRELDPALRVPWFGPPMSAASSLTARIMETWAHGQDVADALGVRREPTDRLRHVAHIGVAARAFSYRVHERAAPTDPIRVELVGPDGALWTWGPPDAPDRVTGSALDFALAVTQRRHHTDTALVISGPAAQEWMSIAQAFAGAAGTGRTPGQFAGRPGRDG